MNIQKKSKTILEADLNEIRKKIAAARARMEQQGQKETVKKPEIDKQKVNSNASDLLKRFQAIKEKRQQSEQKTEIKEIEPKVNKGEAKQDLYARAEIYVEHHPTSPDMIAFAKKVFKLPDQLDEFKEACLSRFEDLKQLGREHDNYGLVTPTCKIYVAVKTGDEYKKVDEFHTKSSIGIKHIIQRMSGGDTAGNNVKLPGSNVITYNVYVEGMYKGGRKVGPISIVKDGKAETTEETYSWQVYSNKTYKEIMRKLLLLKNKLQKDVKKGEGHMSSDTYEDTGSDWALENIMVVVELMINGKKEGEWEKGINWVRKASERGYSHFEALDKMNKEFKELRKSKIIGEENMDLRELMEAGIIDFKTKSKKKSDEEGEIKNRKKFKDKWDKRTKKDKIKDAIRDRSEFGKNRTERSKNKLPSDDTGGGGSDEGDGGNAAVEARGFKNVQKKISKQYGGDMKKAGAILASRTRNASPEAKEKNPNLKKVK